MMTLNNYTFGLRPEKRKDILENFVFTAPLSKDIVIADRISIRKDMSPVVSQGQEGACVGGGMVKGVLEYLQKRDYGKLILLSMRWLYNKARDRGGYSEGATLSDACYIAHKEGVPEEKYWPYFAGDKRIVPLHMVLNGESVEDNALKYRIKSYAKVPDLKRLIIAMNDPLVRCVLIGIKVYQGMIDPECKKTGIVPDPSCFQFSKGGHCQATSEYDNKSNIYKKPGHVEAKNSWGLKYGDEGFNKFSFNYIKKNMISAYACTDIPKEELKNKTVKVSDISTYDIKKEGLWIPKK